MDVASTDPKDPAVRLSDARYRKFGLWLGIGVAVLAHALIFLIPGFGGKKEEPAVVERGLRARAYRIQPASSAQGAQDTAASSQRPQPVREAREADAPASSEAAIPSPSGPPPALGASDSSRGVSLALSSGEDRGAALPDGGDNMAGQADSGAPAPARGGAVAGRGDSASSGGGQGRQSASESSAAPAQAGGQASAGSGSGSDWDKMLSMLGQQRDEITKREETVRTVHREQTVKKERSKVEEKAEPDNYLDSRIRMQVVSYPPSAIENSYTPISYPDLKLKRSQMKAGICRVYLRLYIDKQGRLSKTEVKTPATKEELEIYEPFVTKVKDSVFNWNFEPREAQVHVDVLFEIQ